MVILDPLSDILKRINKLFLKKTTGNKIKKISIEISFYMQCISQVGRES